MPLALGHALMLPRCGDALDYSLLLEDGDDFLLEDGDELLLEGQP